MRTPFTLFFSLLMPVLLWGQDKLSTEEYIAKYKEIAVAEMYRTGIPASITLAQGILESGSGNSRLAVEANNHFGIKCHEWNGDFIREDDDLDDECFRKYADALQSYLDHSEFLMSRSRYDFLFSYDKTDYKKWARGLKKAGYATNPKYAPLLIDLIERYELHQYDFSSMPEIAYKKIDNSNDPVALKHNSPKQMYQKGIFENNRIETVILQPDQDLADVAKAYDKRVSRLERYNEINDGYQVVPGMKVYLQPKRNKGEVKHHTVKEGETMFLISQNYGIKLEKLYKRNLMSWGSEPETGETLRLRGNRDEPPQLREGKPAPDTDSFFQNLVEFINPFDSDADDINKPENPAKQPKPVLPGEEAKKEAPAKKAEQPTVQQEPDKPEKEAPATDTARIANNETPAYEPYEDKRPKYQYEQQQKGELEDDEASSVEDKMADNMTEKVSEPPIDKKTTIRHTVEDGDTLYSISKRYEVSMSKIKKWNGLENSNIQIGQTLIVGKGQ